MPWLVEKLNHVSAGWASLMGTALWQSLVLAVLFAGLSVLLKNRSPGLRYWLWQILAVKLLLLPFWTLGVPVSAPVGERAAEAERALEPGAANREQTGEQDEETEQPSLAELIALLKEGRADEPVASEPDVASESGASASVSSTESERSEPVSVWSLTWPSWLMFAWLTIVGALFARLAWHRWQLSRLLCRATPGGVQLAETVQKGAERLGLKSSPAIVLTDVHCSPFICGVRRPVVVLPMGLVETLTAEQLDQVLLHELAHLKRGDLIWGWLPELSRIVYFFNPVVHWMCGRIRLERELACDQLVMAASGARAGEYAETLVQVVSHASQPSLFRHAVASILGLGGEEREPPPRSSHPGNSQTEAEP